MAMILKIHLGKLTAGTNNHGCLAQIIFPLSVGCFFFSSCLAVHFQGFSRGTFKIAAVPK